jgi:hypothetical protein
MRIVSINTQFIKQLIFIKQSAGKTVVSNGVFAGHRSCLEALDVPTLPLGIG